MGIDDWIFVGKVVKQSDLISNERVSFLYRRKTRLLVARRFGQYKLVFKTIETCGWLYGEVKYSTISMAAIPQLRKEFPSIRQWLDEVEEASVKGWTRSRN